MGKHTISDLYQMQSLPLSAKIRMTEQRIKGWIEEYGIDGVYVSFSGGKDSTVLLYLARQIDRDIKAMFVDTGLEYPEIREFVKSFHNVDWERPKMTFRQVIEKYGYPFISKEVSECVDGARKFLRGGVQPILPQVARNRRIPEREHTCSSTTNYADKASMLRPTRGGGTTTSIVNFEDWENIPVRVKILFGKMTKGNIPNGDRSRFSCERYKFFLDADFEISSKCCSVMKKAPAHNYAKKTGRKPMTAQMASESRLRTQQWLKNGCNGFDMKKPISNPMSFWTEQDVLLFIHEYKDQILKWRIEEIETAFNGMVYGNKIVNRQTGATICSVPTMPICSVYGEVVTDYAGQGQVEGQLTFADMGIFEKERPLLKTTGCDRTGCMFCGYGCHLEKPGEGRFERMKETHPRQYAYIMRGGHWKYRIFNFKGEEISLKHCSQEQIESWVAQNKDNIRFKIEKHGFYLDGTGLGFKEIIDWINEHGNLNIKY